MDNYRTKSLKMRFTYNIVNYQLSGIVKIKNYEEYNWSNCLLLPVHLNHILRIRLLKLNNDGRVLRWGSTVLVHVHVHCTCMSCFMHTLYTV